MVKMIIWSQSLSFGNACRFPAAATAARSKTRLAQWLLILLLGSVWRSGSVVECAASRHHSKDDNDKLITAPSGDTPTNSSTRAADDGTRRRHSSNGDGLASRPVSSSSRSYDGNYGDDDVRCIGLRSKRYISDGFCRTLNPISETLCTGFCVPPRALPNYAEFVKAWSARGGTSSNHRRKQPAGAAAIANGASNNSSSASGKSRGAASAAATAVGGGGGGGAGRALGYRCIDGVVRNRRVKLVCDNGDVKIIRMPVVKSCACSSSISSHYYDGRSNRQRQHRGGGAISSAESSSASSSSSRTGTGSGTGRHHHQRPVFN